MKKIYLFTSILAATMSVSVLHAQNIHTIAGTLGIGTDDGSVSLPALSAHFKKPFAVVVNANTGNIVVADQNNNKVKLELSIDHKIYSIAGNGAAGYKSGRGDTSLFNETGGLWVNFTGDTILVCDVQNQVVRKIATSVASAGYFFTTTIAGTVGSMGFSGDGSAATSAQFKNPYSVWKDASGNIYVADAGNNRIRKIDVSGNISTYAGTGTPGFSGDGSGASSAELNSPTGIFIDSTNMMYIADQGNQRVRKIDMSTGTITTVAGNGTMGYAGDNGSATSAELNNPTGVCMFAGNIYIADRDNNRIRRVTSGGIITTIAGAGTAGSTGDGGLATAALLNAPSGVYADNYGIYIADQGNHVIRQVDMANAVPGVEQQLIARIYPNPSEGKFAVVLPAGTKNTNLEVYNMFGAVIYKSTITAGMSLVDISAQTDGVYYIHLTCGASIAVQKIVVTH